MEDIIKKFKFKNIAVILNAPENLALEFKKAGMKDTLTTDHQSRNTLVFLYNRQELITFLKEDLKTITYDGVLWFAYPKGSSKIKIDINRDSIRVKGEEFGITAVTAIAIDETWSALRFRPIEMVGK